ncbi:MAG: DMT family transporter [Acidaminococcaceae bacterium]|nr:DMT family transporter [Acidaminococcaceae bacterium]
MWFVYAILTTLIWGLAELFYKKAADPSEPYTHLKTCIWVGAVMGLHACYILATQDINYQAINLIKYLPVSAFYIVSMTCAFFGVRYIEVSLASPIENTSGAVCSLLCVLLLGKTLELPSVIAILAIVCGILGIGFLENRNTDRRKKIGKTLAVIGFAMPFIYAFLDAFGTFLDIYYLDIATSPLIGITEDTIEDVANTSYELTFCLCAIILYIFLKCKNVQFQLPQQKDKIFAALCETAGQFTYVYAMSDNGAIAAPIISSVCVVPLVLSKIFLNEKLTLLQYFFISLIVMGIIGLAIMEGE